MGISCSSWTSSPVTSLQRREAWLCRVLPTDQAASPFGKVTVTPALLTAEVFPRASQSLSQCHLVCEEQTIICLSSSTSFLLSPQQALSLFSGGWYTQPVGNCCFFWRREEKDLWMESNISIKNLTL